MSSSAVDADCSQVHKIQQYRYFIRSDERELEDAASNCSMFKRRQSRISSGFSSRSYNNPVLRRGFYRQSLTEPLHSCNSQLTKSLLYSRVRLPHQQKTNRPISYDMYYSMIYSYFEYAVALRRPQNAIRCLELFSGFVR